MEDSRARDREVVEAVVEGHGFHLVYQPIVHLDTGDVAGVEALCRFDDGAPTEHRFRMCEELGLAAPLDLAIVETALADFPHLPGGYLALNLSASTVCDRSLQALFEAADVPGSRLVIEITEHARIPDYQQAAAVIEALRARGIRLAVDDAGAGWASFRHILSLRPDIIKMDRSLTRGVDVDPARRAVSESTSWVSERSILMMSGRRLRMWRKLAQPAPASSTARRTPFLRSASITDDACL